VLPLEGETHAEAHLRWTTEFHALQLNPESMPPDAEKAQQTFARFLKELVSPVLRKLGFKGSGAKFRLDQADFRGGLEFQRSTHSTRAVVEFTINLSAVHRPTSTGFWWSRLGVLMPEFHDFWWRLPAGAPTEELLDDVAQSITNYGHVALQAALDEPGYPEDPDRIWGKTFGEDPGQGRFSRPLPYKPLRPTNVDDAIERLTDPVSNIRSSALFFIFKNARDDPRLVPALIDFLDHEPRTLSRAAAAKYLGFVPGETEMVLAALNRTAQEDEDLTVRVLARYALALIRRRLN
jgi:hypothetical protein